MNGNLHKETINNSCVKIQIRVVFSLLFMDLVYSSIFAPLFAQIWLQKTAVEAGVAA